VLQKQIKEEISMTEIQSILGEAPIGQNYDKPRVSKQVQQRVNSIITEGKKIKGSADEVKGLGQYLQELAESGANVHEQQYVQGYISKYQTKAEQETAKAEQKKQENIVSDGAREDLKNAMGDAKKIYDGNVRNVLDMINNKAGNYSKPEIEFFRQEVIKAGFGELLLEPKQDSTGTKEEPISPSNETPIDHEDPHISDGAENPYNIEGTPKELSGKKLDNDVMDYKQK
jgi:hypothetical protein